MPNFIIFVYVYIMKTANIYSLVDPITQKIRYIGFTTFLIEKRLKEHIDESSSNKRTYKLNWIRKLLKKGVTPTIKLVEVVPFEIVDQKEIYWVSYFKNLGEPLVNGTKGGRGAPGHIHDKKDRIKISRSLKGRKLSKEHIASIKKGKEGLDLSHTDESKEKISKGLKGKPKSEEHKAKLKAARAKQVITEETKQIGRAHV